jgi:cytochrome c biogenesis protein CcmG/thiol:disulfide interchange protein DsbE
MIERDASAAPRPRKTSHMSTIISLVVGLGLVALLVVALLTRYTGRPQLGDPAPDFTLMLLDGSQMSLGDLRGQVAVVNFWASWCGPCRREAPALQQVWESYQDQGVAFLGLSYQDARNASQSFVEEFGITYPNGIDARGRISKSYGITGVPETFVIDRDGNVVWFNVGEVSADTLIEQLERTLGG